MQSSLAIFSPNLEVSRRGFRWMYILSRWARAGLAGENLAIFTV